METNGYMMVDGIQVHKVMTASQSERGNVWIYNTVCTGYTWSLVATHLVSAERVVVAFGECIVSV
jgi:hypothetical protein